MSLSEKIQVLRKQKNISQEQLAEKLNVSRQAISKWETGDSLPDIDNILRLSSIFDVSTDYLLKTDNGEVVSDFSHNTTAESWQDTGTTNEFITGHNYYDEDNSSGRFEYSLNFKGIIYPLAVLVFLSLGFIWGLWRIGWVVFIIAWLLEEIVSYLRNGRLDISIYSIASVVYLILGFGWALWHPGWLVFVVAWVIEEAIQVKKPKKKKRKKHDDW